MATANNVQTQLESLVKALDAGNYNAAPGSLVQGSALQVEDLSPVMQNVTFGDEHLVLQQMLTAKSCKSIMPQFDRQLSYGSFGGSAQLEGNLGAEKTSDFVRITVPMCFYSHARRVTIASTLVNTVDGMGSEERAAGDAAKIISADIEWDLFRGRADFSNAGVFDGNPLVTPSSLPNMIGVDVHIRQSDVMRNAQDVFFNEFGADESSVVPGGGPLTQDLIEEATLRSTMHMGQADKLVVDPRVLSVYNRLSYGKERIILAGSAQGNTGSDLRKQYTSAGAVEITPSRFLSGKTSVAPAKVNGPLAPTIASVTPGAISGATTPFVAGNIFTYFVSAANEVGESRPTAASTGTIATTGHGVTVVITPPGSGTIRFFNVYRSAAGGTAATAKFIGRVAAAASGNTTFIDIGNKQPGFSTGFLLQSDTMEMKDLANYSRLKLAVADLSVPEAHFRFTTLAVMQPRKNTLIDNLR